MGNSVPEKVAIGSSSAMSLQDLAIPTAGK